MAHKSIRPIISLLIALVAIGAGIFYIALSPGADADETYNFASMNAGTADKFIPGEETPAQKNETVYVLLDHDGSATNQRIVNRIYGQIDPSASTVVDHGHYLSVENMVAAAEPIVEEGRLLWDSRLLSGEDLYYEGILEKDPPVSINIDYFLDGKPISAADLAGKSGRLDLVIKAKNNLRYEEPISYYDYEDNLTTVEDTNYVPFLVQGELEADLNRFSNIDTGDGINIITGQNARINFMIFPYPEAETTISMDGEDIELDNITFVVSPQLPPLPDMEIEDELLAMLEGLSLLDDGMRELSSGADQLLQGLTRFQNESSSLSAGTGDMDAFIEGYRKLSGQYRALMAGTDMVEIAGAVSALQKLLGEVDEIPEPAAITEEIKAVAGNSAELAKQIEELNSSLDGLGDTSSPIKHEAERLIAENEPGSDLHQLGLLLLEREEQVEKALSERRLLERTIGELTAAVGTLDSEWTNSYAPGLQALQELDNLLAGDTAAMLEELPALIDQLSHYEDYFNQIEGILDAADDMAENLALLPGALDKLVYGQTQISVGLKELRVRGILAMKKGLIEGINEYRFGAAKIDLMTMLADDYKSYADNEHNRHSEVQFIMQTAAITIDQSSVEQLEAEKDTEKKDHWSANLWAKITSLLN